MSSSTSITASAASSACAPSRPPARRTTAWKSITPAATSCSCRSRTSSFCRATARKRRASSSTGSARSAWQSRKARMKNRIREIAGELIKIAAERQLHEAPRLTVETGLYDEFCAGFPYEETDDQQAAIAAVACRSRLRPADGSAHLRRRRLRQDRSGAARRLHRRHERQAGRGRGADHAARAPALQDFFRTAARLSGQDRAGLAARHRQGARRRSRKASPRAHVDIVVGTHALLGKTVKFKDLGLIVVDEEQHFGVGAQGEAQAAARRGARADADRDADPAHACSSRLSGVREMSIIATPPVDRLAVRTFVSPFDPVVVREALLRERYRGGQCFLCLSAHRGSGRNQSLPRQERARGARCRRPRPDAVDRARRRDGGVL